MSDSPLRRYWNSEIETMSLAALAAMETDLLEQQTDHEPLDFYSTPSCAVTLVEVARTSIAWLAGNMSRSVTSIGIGT